MNRKALLWPSVWVAVGVLAGGLLALALIEQRTLPSGLREPYLQILSPTGVTIRWRTMQPEIGWVRYGRSRHDLDSQVAESSASTIHEVRLDDLEPGTRYYYSVGFGDEVFEGGTADHWFHTAPPVGTRQATRIWVIGDSGGPTDHSRAVKNAMLSWADAHPRERDGTVDLVLMLGDNAYKTAKDIDYQRGLFDRYAELLINTPAWPTQGNHDAKRGAAYFTTFAMPRDGEAGGVPSGTARYYSFDYANIHFLGLDSQTRRPTGEMLAWLKEDLANTRQEWLITFWHHPPYSKGSHDSDDAEDSRGRMRRMREEVLPILEEAGVDLVLSGHSHSYERSFLLDRHYGTSDTLEAAMILDRGDGRPSGDGAYRKATPGPGPHEGAVYAVVGSSSKTASGPMDHPAMFRSEILFGSMVVEVRALRLDAYFIDATGRVVDEFTILKGDPAPQE